MTQDEFITATIDAGQREGIARLDRVQRLVFLISEAECFCDMEGIDSFLDRYAPDWLDDAATAFDAVGAKEIAAELRSVPSNPPVGDPRLNRLNELVTSRAGYNYDSIRLAVTEWLQADGGHDV